MTGICYNYFVIPRLYLAYTIPKKNILGIYHAYDKLNLFYYA